jgi:hypothetical protein
MNGISTNNKVFTGYFEESKTPVTCRIHREFGDVCSYDAFYEDQTIGKADVLFSNRDEDESVPRYTYLLYLSNETNENEEIPKINRIGTALIEWIIEDCIEIDEGRIKLYSAPGALGFYWKLGFRLEESTNNRRKRATEFYVELLNSEIEISKISKDHPSIINSFYYRQTQLRLAKKLGKLVSEVDVFEDIKKRPPSLISDKIVKKIKKAGKAKPDTSKLGLQILYLPGESLAIWNEIINNPETRKKNFKKLKAVPQRVSVHSTVFKE